MNDFELSAAIGRYIAEKNPRIRYFTADIEAAKKVYSEEDLIEMREVGLITDDFEAYYVIREFLDLCGISEAADGSYLLELFRFARRLDAEEFRSNPYIRTIRFPETKHGNILLSTAEYRRGEILQYDMPDFSARTVVPRLGFFDRTVRFPTIYENKTPWMSVCPSEINSMKEPIEVAHGRVLVLGLGLGYYPFMISEKLSVDEITIVERNPRIIDLFKSYILPQFPDKDKIRVIEDDAIRYIEAVPSGAYDFCFADIWEGVVDGAEPYQRIKSQEARLPSTEFAYWIEPQIQAYLSLL